MIHSRDTVSPPCPIVRRALEQRGSIRTPGRRLLKRRVPRLSRRGVGYVSFVSEQADGSNYRDESKSIADTADGSNYDTAEDEGNEPADGSNYRDDDKSIAERADGSNFQRAEPSSDD